MKESLQGLPGLLCITGQAGAGKDTLAKILLAWCEKIGLRVLYFSSGDLIRHYTESDTDLGKELRTIHENAERAPLEFIGKLVQNYIQDNHAGYDHIILNGTPRYAEHCDMLHGMLAEKKYFQSLMILEVIANEEICRTRLFERTALDKRADLSMDGQPGVPDPKKIARKMAWWTDEVPSIRKRAQGLGLYCSIRNETDDIAQKNQLAELFC